MPAASSQNKKESNSGWVGGEAKEEPARHQKKAPKSTSLKVMSIVPENTCMISDFKSRFYFRFEKIPGGFKIGDRVRCTKKDHFSVAYR